VSYVVNFFSPHRNIEKSSDFSNKKIRKMLPQLNQYLFIHHFYLLDFVLRSSSSQAEDINKLHFYFLYAAAFILLVVTVFTIYVLKKFQNKVGEE